MKVKRKKISGKRTKSTRNKKIGETFPNRRPGIKAISANPRGTENLSPGRAAVFPSIFYAIQGAPPGPG
jgi:hypothetical protein